MKRLAVLVLAALAVFTLTYSLAAKVCAQDIVRKEEPKQNLTLLYPNDGIVLEGKGDDVVRYKGIIYVKVYPVSARLKKELGEGPVFSNELQPGYLGDGDRRPALRLPLGEYEVHFSMRDADDLRTCIKRNVILTRDTAPLVTAELSGTAKTLVIGGDISFQEMENAVYELAVEVKELKAEVAALKGGKPAAAVPAK